MSPYRGELVYECRYCGQEIFISRVVSEVDCPGCRKHIRLTSFLQEYLLDTFGEVVQA